MLSASDEGLHARPPGGEAWQENCFLLGRDAGRDVSVYVHVERMADGVEVKAAVDVGGSTTWQMTGDDWWPDVEVAYERLAVSWTGGDLRIDLTLESHLAPADHGAALAALQLPGTERDHYEVVGRMLGTVAIDGDEVHLDGLFVRDHTWGVRQYQQFGNSWWWPTCFDGGDAYLGGVAVDVGGQTLGYGIVVDGDGQAAGTDVAIDVDGEARPGAYTGTTVRFTPAGREPVVCVGVVDHHLCTTFPAFGPDRRWNEGFSSCRWGDRIGFGTRELGC
ncbi:MAG: hypothetical protein H0W25_12180 [Acidimicrobiia bacterium]|nr:hypothetical protein [Acidimicrobiia bacterium]